MENTCIVIDNGSSTSKVGLSGEDAPRTKFRTVVGRPKIPSIMVGMDQKEAYVGEQAQNKRGVLNMSCPIQHGVIQNWEDMIKIWHNCFYNELRVAPEQHPCLLTQVSTKQSTQESIKNGISDVLNFQSIQAALALYSTGRTTGVVLESGDGLTSSVPIYEGYALPDAIQRNDFGGRDLTKQMHQLLQQVGMKFSYSAEYHVLNEIKQKHCYIAQDYDREIQDYIETNRNDCKYKLPDGQTITLGNQRFRCPQVMFKPEKYGLEMAAVHQMVYQAIMKCDLDVRRELYSNVILSGGNTMFSGTPQRMMKELKTLTPSTAKVNVLGPAERQYLPWIGGSILSSMATFHSMWISKSQFVENGPNIVHRKCF